MSNETHIGLVRIMVVRLLLQLGAEKDIITEIIFMGAVLPHFNKGYKTNI
jgi:hypothetical protein